MAGFGLREFRIIRLSAHSALEALAGRPSLPDAAVWELASSRWALVPTRIAANPTAPAEALAVMARDARASVRRSVAGNASTPAPSLVDLSNDSDGTVAAAVAGNAATPADLLLNMSTVPKFRTHIAANPAAPVELLRVWLQEAVGSGAAQVEWTVLAALSSNAALPQDILDACVEISREREDEDEILAEDRESVRIQMASNPVASPELLATLAGDMWRIVRANVAANPNTPREVIAHLAKDKEEDVRRGVAVNSSTPVDILTELHDAEPRNSWVHEDLAANPRLPAGLIRRYAQEFKRPVISNPTFADSDVWDFLEQILEFDSGSDPVPWLADQ